MNVKVDNLFRGCDKENSDIYIKEQGYIILVRVIDYMVKNAPRVSHIDFYECSIGKRFIDYLVE